MRSDLDRLVMHVPTALVPRGVGSIDLTTGLRGITAKSRCLRARRERRGSELLASLHVRTHLIVGHRAVTRKDPVASGPHLLRRRHPTREHHGEGGAECEEEWAHPVFELQGLTDRGPLRNHRDHGSYSLQYSYK